MKTVLHRSTSRGHADHGWLDTFHTFSFGGYYDPERVHFGALRVLNDDKVEGGMGFGSHPHDNMEIVSIPLEGALEHKDNMGNQSVIKANDVQIMSAGTGVVHSEYNHSQTEKVNFLQIWVFPGKKNIDPRYDQKTFLPGERKNKIQTVISPRKDDDAIWINQEAYFSLGSLDRGENHVYQVNNPENGVYLFVIDGKLKAGGEQLARRDGIGIWDTEKIDLETEENSEVLLIEVPMN